MKIRSLALILVLALAVLFFWRKSNEAAPIADQKQNTPAPPRQKLIDQAKAFKGLEIANLSPEEKSGVCASSLESIETLPLESLAHDLAEGKLQLSDQCLGLGPTKPALLQGFPEICQQLVDGRPTQICLDQLFFYKALRIQRATKNENLDGLSNEMLISKFIGLLAGELIADPNGFKSMGEIGRKIYERLPLSESAAKAALVGYMARDQLSETETAEADQLLIETREKFPESWEIYEMDLLAKNSKSKELYKNEILRFHEANPESPIGIYYLGCMHWSQGDVGAARDYFRQAHDKSPQDQRFEESFQKSLTAQASEKVCSVKISFHPSQF